MIIYSINFFRTMPRKYTNDELKLLNKEIRQLKKDLKIFKSEKNEEMIAKTQNLIDLKELQHDDITYSVLDEVYYREGITGIYPSQPP